jgi:hypothetical protein
MRIRRRSSALLLAIVLALIFARQFHILGSRILLLDHKPPKSSCAIIASVDGSTVSIFVLPVPQLVEFYDPRPVFACLVVALDRDGVRGPPSA